jgi:hypothetical protein
MCWKICLERRRLRPLINSIPLSRTNQLDKKIWKGTANGLFSVKSAYHLAKEIEDRQTAECSMGLQNSDVWKLIWKLKVPNVEKNFIWRVCHDILPTRDNLLRRKVVTDPSCPMCGLEVETPIHLLWNCPSAMDVWGASCKKLMKSTLKGPRFINVVEEVLQNGNEEETKLFVGLARKLWLRRNEILHGGRFCGPDAMIEQVKKAIEDFELASGDDSCTTRQQVSQGDEKWQAPPVGKWKAN